MNVTFLTLSISAYLFRWALIVVVAFCKNNPGNKSSNKTRIQGRIKGLIFLPFFSWIDNYTCIALTAWWHWTSFWKLKTFIIAVFRLDISTLKISLKVVSGSIEICNPTHIYHVRIQFSSLKLSSFICPIKMRNTRFRNDA